MKRKTPPTHEDPDSLTREERLRRTVRRFLRRYPGPLIFLALVNLLVMSIMSVYVLGVGLHLLIEIPSDPYPIRGIAACLMLAAMAFGASYGVFAGPIKRFFNQIDRKE